MNCLQWLAFFFLITSTSSQTRRVSYTGEKVLHCSAPTLYVKEASDLLNDPSVDVWATHADGSIDVRVLHDHVQPQLRRFFGDCQVVIPDVEEFVSNLEGQRQKPASNLSVDWFSEYHTYEATLGWYQELSSDFPELVKYEVIGASLEDREIPAVRIGAGSGEGKEKIFFQCQIHAREWITSAVCMYVVEYLVFSYGEVPQVTNLLENLEVLVVPFVNPDGYEYTWTVDRLWRKNRARNQGSSCRGVDLNRNYNDHWNEGGSSSNPCSDTYHGPYAESEPETMVVTRFFRENGPIIGAIDWHSYSQLILRPYGWTDQDSPDEPMLKELGDLMSDRAYAVHEKRYISQKSIGLYPTTGTASDWFYGEDATSSNGGYRAASFTIELRDTGAYGFLLPPDQIIPNGQEMVAAVQYFIDFCLNNPIRV